MGQRDDGAGKPRAAGAEFILPAAGVVFTLYYFSTILHSPWEAQAAAFFVGSLLILLSIAFIVRTLFEVRNGRANFGFDRLVSEGTVTLKRAGLFALTLLYILLIGWLGFTITTFLYLTSAMLVLGEGRRPLFVTALAAGISLLGFLLFIVAFETRFPRGPFETFMAASF